MTCREGLDERREQGGKQLLDSGTIAEISTRDLQWVWVLLTGCIKLRNWFLQSVFKQALGNRALDTYSKQFMCLDKYQPDCRKKLSCV